jgi:hypothetical protein
MKQPLSKEGRMAMIEQMIQSAKANYLKGFD